MPYPAHPRLADIAHVAAGAAIAWAVLGNLHGNLHGILRAVVAVVGA